MTDDILLTQLKRAVIKPAYEYLHLLSYIWHFTTLHNLRPSAHIHIIGKLNAYALWRLSLINLVRALVNPAHN
jgi:hypothetical protein